MISKVINFVENPNHLIELYCGVGTFTLTLSKVFNFLYDVLGMPYYFVIN